MKQKTRYNIGLAKKRGVVTHVRTNPNGVSLYELLRSNAKRLGIFAMPRKWYEAQVESFGKKCFAVLAYHNSELVAGNFFMTSNDACFYSHNGSTELGRKLMAPSLCVWEGISEARKRKLKIFDFDGIDDGSNNLKRWKGFTKFKEGYNPKVIEFLGTWDLVINKPLYTIYKLAEWIRWPILKIAAAFGLSRHRF